MEATQELTFLNALLPLTGVIFIIAFGVVLLNKHFQKNLYVQKLEREELKNIHQQELLRSSIQTQEDERKRIASDLHDELGAVLAIARMHLIQLEEQHANNTTLSAPLQNVRSLAETALASMRRISHELMPPQLESFGIVKTLEGIASRANITNGMHVEIIARDNIPKLPWPVQLGLYRISMELIANTVKHARANQISIQLKWEFPLLLFCYADNGNGLPACQVVTGSGRKNIEARVISMGGTIIQEDASKTGFSTTLQIPLKL